MGAHSKRCPSGGMRKPLIPPDFLFRQHIYCGSQPMPFPGMGHHVTHQQEMKYDMVNIKHIPATGHSETDTRPLCLGCREPRLWEGPDTCMALAGETPIPTLDGWVALRDIEPGQTVFDEGGQPCSVTAVRRRGWEPVFRIEFDDRAVLLAGEHHHWVSIEYQQRHRVSNGRDSLAGWATNLMPATTAEIRESLVSRGNSGDRAMHSIPLARPLQCPEAELAIDPYLLGLWLGDGSRGAAIVTCHKDDEPHYRMKASAVGENWRIRDVTAMCDTLSCTLTRGPSPLFWSRLREMSVLREKHIPPSYLRAGYDQRLQLLQGLMDSDGYIAPETGTAEFTSTSEVLAKGTFELVLSLGQKATLLKGDATLYGIRVSDKWRVRYSPSIVVFSLPRKVGCLQPHLDRRRQADVPRTGQRYIKSVEQIGEKLTLCVTADSFNRMMLAGQHMIPVRTAGNPGNLGNGR